MKRPPPRRSAFTLIELLTVIAIIGILAAILVPVVGSARALSRTSACLANLRQIAAASILYSEENKGLLVPITITSTGPTWRYELAPYLSGHSANLDSRGTFACPADLAENGPAAPDTANSGRRPYSYGVNKSTNLHRYISTPARSAPASAVKRPSRTIFVSDLGRVLNPTAATSEWQANTSTTNNSLGYARFPGDSNFTGGDPWNIFPRHKGKANVAFYDGSARSVDVQTQIIGHPAGSSECLFNN